MTENLSRYFKISAIAEACGWALLIFGMILKYGTKTTQVGVQVGGMVHGILFLTYCFLALRMWQSKGWSGKTMLLAIISAIVPFMTIWFERHIERTGQA